jgi:hypothetical protein
VTLVAVTLLLAGAGVGQEIAQAPAETQPPAYDQLIRAAGERFAVPDENRLAAVKAELVKRMNELERFVRPGSANGRQWLSYLRWAPLKEQLGIAAGPADLSALAVTREQLNRNEAGLELPQFRRVADALRQYIDLLLLARAENPAAIYQRQLEALSADLEGLRRQRGAGQLGRRAADDLEIGDRLEFITGVGQASELVAAIRKEFAGPNAYLDMSVELVRAAAEEPIDRRDPITDNILGTHINGDGHTTGFVLARTVPSGSRATIELTSKGHVESANRGRNGPAVIRSTGHTDFTATKEIYLSDKEFRAPPAQVNATSQSDIHSIAKSGGGIGSRLVSTQGWKRANQNRSRVNEIAADHAEDRIRRRIDDEVAEKLRDARQRYEDEYRRPLARRGELAEHIQFGSTADALTIVATQANRRQLGAPAGPPALPANRDLVLRLHDSAVNNYSAAVLGGATASETEPNQDKAKFDVELPKWMSDAWEQRKTDGQANTASTEAFKPWSLTFRAVRPLTVAFADEKVSLTIHLARLKSGDEVFEDWDVTGVFTPILEDGGVVLRREGELVVLPSDFDPRSGEQLPSRQVGIRSNLAKVLNERSAQGRGFPSRIEFSQLEPSGSLEKVGPLEARELKSNDGWLTLGWHRKGSEG